MKIVVIDLDETLGYFIQLSMTFNSLNKYINNYQKNKCKITQSDFNDILDLYPEFIRPNIIQILNYLKDKKDKKICDKIIIYTNNRGQSLWISEILSYFEKKINYKLFDQVIRPFKINGEIIESGRTSCTKKYKDFIKCAKIHDSSNLDICFIDDIFFPKMKNKNIYYINIKPYIHNIELKDIVIRFINSDVCNRIINDKNNCGKIMLKYIEQYRFDFVSKSAINYEIDIIIGKQIMYHIKYFFNKHIQKKN